MCISHNVKKYLLFTCIICVLFILSACSIINTDSVNKIKLCEVTRSVFYCPQYIALSQGFFNEENLQIELTSAEGSDKVMTAILSSQSDIGLIGTSAVISVIEQGKEKHPVAFAGLTERDGSFLISRTPNFKWDDMRGKEIISGRKGGVPEMVLEHVLRTHGINPESDLKLLNNIQFNLMSVAFGRGIGDYVCLFEPIASRIVNEKNFYNLMSIGNECPPIPYTCYCASIQYMRNNTEIIQKFTNAIYKAQKWIKVHTSEEIAQNISKYFIDFDIESLTECVEKYKNVGVWSQNPLIQKDGFEYLEQIMRECNELNSNIEYEKAVDNTWAKNSIYSDTQ